MIDCTSAYNAARVLLDDDKIDIELMTKIGYECPAFTRLVYMSRDNSTLLLLLKSLERANVDVYKIERGLRYALGQKIVYNNATLQKADDVDTYSEASAPVHDDNAAAFVLDLDKENMRMLEHKLNIFHTMTARELYKACVDRDIAKLCKDKKKPTLIAALRKYEIEHAATSGIVIDDKDKDEDEDEDNGTETASDASDAPYSQYSTMTVQELYDECKRRDMDVPARQRKQIYIDLLTSDDNIREAQSGDNIDDIDMTNPDEWEI